LIDASPSSTTLLVAPAGYGKTTLLRQWREAADVRAAWCPCTPASADVARLAIELAAALASVTGSSFNTLSERLKVTRQPQLEADVLAEIFLDALGAVDPDTVIVMDDYQAICLELAAEEFVERTLVASGVRVVLASRVRPRWATARRLLYGEITEIDARHLAMSDTEAHAVFETIDREVPPDLMARADGWPAVITLSLLSGKTELRATGALEQFLAEEVCSWFDADVVDGLAVLSAMASIPRSTADALLGPELATRCIESSTTAGLLTEVDRECFELHPLIREFLAERSVELTAELETAIVAHCVSSENWDELFDLAVRFRSIALTAALFVSGARKALDEGRLASVQRWVSFARLNRMEISLLQLVEADIALRNGLYTQAETLALSATDHEGDNGARFWGLSLAGRAAHLAGREHQALAYYQEARAAARSERDRREATIGELKSAIDLEQPNAADVLKELSRNRHTDATDEVELGALALMLGSRMGSLEVIDEAKGINQLLPNVSDPLVRNSFRNTYAYACAVAGEYDEADAALSELERDASDHRLRFALAYVLLGRAVVSIGRRQFDGAFDLLTQAATEARRTGDAHVIASCAATRARALIALGRFDEARAVAAYDHPELIAAMRAELLCAQALAAACAEHGDEAVELIERAENLSGAVEVPVSGACVRAIVSARADQAEADQRAGAAAGLARSTRYVDGLLAAYRGFPDLARRIARDDSVQSWFASLLVRAEDDAIAQIAGLGARRSPQSLSRREAEVFDLVRLGLTNKEIATRLFISEGTAKLHVHHILEKLGASSRTQAALMAPRIG
jgi:ATP/maltotriose-dependent transcriptional regulator MalT